MSKPEMPKARMLFVGARPAVLPIVLPVPFAEMRPDRQSKIWRDLALIGALLSADREREATKLAIALEVYLGVTIPDRMEAVRKVINWPMDWQRPKPVAPSGPGSVRDLKQPPLKQVARAGLRVTPERRRHGLVVEEAVDIVVWDRDATGDRANGRRIPDYHASKSFDSNVRKRLGAYHDLDADQIDAGVTFESEWSKGKMEPRITANLTGAGGGGGDAMASLASTEAFKRRTAASWAALRCAGREALGIVEAVVLNGESSRLAGAPHYRDPKKGAVYVATTLGLALNVLAEHYRTRRPEHQHEDAA